MAHERFLKRQGIEIRDCLILLGMICQGFAWERGFMPFIFIFLWIAAIYKKRKKRFISEGAEALLFLIILISGQWVMPSLGLMWFTSLGNALAIIQTLRLMWPLTPREKSFSVAMAITHLAIGSQVLYDYRFFFILITALILIPVTLIELEASGFGHHYLKTADLFNWKRIVVVFLIMCIFFLIFPRWRLIPVIPEFVRQHQTLKSAMSSISGGNEGADRLIFRVEGEDVEYLRCFAFDLFNDNSWSASKVINLPRRLLVSSDKKGALYRKVKLFVPSALRSVLPVDGRVIHLEGETIRNPYMTEYGSAMHSFFYSSPITYEYWTHPGLLQETLTEKQTERYLEIPPLSNEIYTFLNQFTEIKKSPFHQARLIVRYFHSNFKYRIGSPDLNRFSPLEEFLFEKREGHCERFASAMTILLRALKIPSRVVIGYLPTEKNLFGDFYNIRDRHGHAWTEAWFENMGWVIMDATPYGSGIRLEHRRLSSMIYEWFDYIWYYKIVDFGYSEQLSLITNITRKFQIFVQFARKYKKMVLTGIFLIILLALFRPWIKRQKWGKIPELERKRAIREVTGFYGQMIHALSREKFFRSPYHTPLEYLHLLERQNHPLIEDIHFVTHCFCQVRYGEAAITPEIHSQLDSSLKKILHHKHHSLPLKY